MINYLLICRSLTYAQRAAKILARTGVTAIVTRTPFEISGEGCGYSVKIPERYLAHALKVLKKSGLPPSRVFTLYSDGRLMEVPG